MVSKNYPIDRNAASNEGEIVAAPHGNVDLSESRSGISCSSCSTMAQMSERSQRSQYRNPVTTGSLHRGRFQYLGERPLEVTSPLKRYGKGPVIEDHPRPSHWSLFKEAWPVLRWVLVLILILIGLGIIIYFLIVETPIMRSNSEKVKIHESQWKKDNMIPGIDDVVSLDGDVILDLGGITYREGNYVTPTTSSYAAADVSSESNKKSSQDFIEIVPAPNLGTSATVQITENTFQSHPHPDQNVELMYATSRLYGLLKESTQHLEKSTEPSETLNTIGNVFSEKHRVSKPPVSPTIPFRQENESTSPQIPYENLCFSPHLEMCRGILPYDLTTLPIIPGLMNPSALSEALPYFELVVESGCSPRARQFLCSLLEPECRPQGDNIVPPCRKACKAVAETCSDFVLTALDLSRVFQCELYPDADDPGVCINLAKGHDCFPNEFLCPDGTCIPNRWLCDNVNDCPNSADEMNCTRCSPDKFKCMTGLRCIPKSWRCDGHNDCEDASDESFCQQKQSCEEGEFQCADDSSCIPYRFRCDGVYQCGDNSDEKNCNRTGRAQTFYSPCPVGELRCLDGRCITLQQLCDGHRDCADGADEANCSSMLTT